MPDIKLFNSTRYDGPMTGQSKFYPEYMSREEIIQDLLERRQRLGELCGFDGKRLFVLSQDSKFEKHTPGQLVDLTEDLSEILEKDPEKDLWSVDRYGDIAYIGEEGPAVVLAYPVADCSVLRFFTREGAIGLSHCGAAEIDRGLPEIALDAFMTKTASHYRDLGLDIGAFAKSPNFIYDKDPSWIKNPKRWDGCVNYDNNRRVYIIDQEKALKRQLYNAGYLGYFYISPEDTVTNPNYYSNCATYNPINPDSKKAGRHLIGLFDVEKQYMLAKESTGRSRRGR